MQELTNAQKEYFQDSKMRDSNGHLKVCYHGTKHDFDSFDNVKKEGSFQTREAGFFFAETRREADAHGKEAGGQTFEVYLDIKNPLIINVFEKDENYALLNKFMKECFPQVKSWQQDHLCTNKFKEYILSKGYDGIITGVPGDSMIIVYNPSQIKSIDNLYPTKSNNFKDNSQDYLQENIGKLSTKEMIEVSNHIKQHGVRNDIAKPKENNKGVEVR